VVVRKLDVEMRPDVGGQSLCSGGCSRAEQSRYELKWITKVSISLLCRKCCVPVKSRSPKSRHVTMSIPSRSELHPILFFGVRIG